MSKGLIEWMSVYKMISKGRTTEQINEFILKNKVCLEKNIDGKSLLYHAIENNEDIAMLILNLKTNFVNEEKSLFKARELRNKKISDVLEKKINKDFFTEQ